MTPQDVDGTYDWSILVHHDHDASVCTMASVHERAGGEEEKEEDEP